MARYAASILFVFNNLGSPSLKKICERKIFLISAKDAEGAYLSATLKGEAEEFSFSDGGDVVHYIFLGVSELISLENEDDDVVWAVYEEKLKPLERIEKIIPPKQRLKAFDTFNKKGKMKLLR
ncbi:MULTISPECIES: hypothetical protein [unclassified Pseudomonas]|uniref:hypothetical protein n=1 Tax=unclassified Pseudomonas TaxID=196821 RepID=UPI002449DAA3|nr:MULTISPECIES: hypothetical protein [unclassified Pseudomonas]MDG9926511.1 hypothetical protein [Pseudomonas sp. GD04042]MDH0481405.1 hypothetical protein [Pseudomonas sp. GD04015]MDH0603354.1 hypothetical protein [Pseudomonas sp. GD03869]